MSFKILITIALVLTVRMQPSPASAAAAAEPASLAMAARIAAMPLQSVQMVPAEPGSAQGPHWLVWSVGRGEGQFAYLALFSVDGRRLWYVAKPDAFLPTLVHVPSWSWQGRAVFLLTLDYGAAAEEAEVIALDRLGLPHVLDRRSASHISLLPDGARLELDQPPGSVPARSCLAWVTISRLQNTRCEP